MARRVLIQAGHVAPREPGFEAGTGTVREQELTKAVRRRLVALLRKDGRFQPIACPGNIPDGIQVDAAVFLHGDGSENASATGYSFGFPQFEVNRKLARLIDEEFKKIPGHPPHHEDNYTGGLREYYGYSRVPTPGPEVLVEHGFLTNPSEQRWIFSNLGNLAVAEYVALCRFFDLEPRPFEIRDRGVMGFRIVERTGPGIDRTLLATLEAARLADKARDARAAFSARATGRVPIQPSPAGSSSAAQDEAAGAGEEPRLEQ